MVNTKKIQRLIVMNDVSSLAHRSNTFANFLTVTRIFWLSLRLHISFYFTGKRNLEKK